MIGLLRNQSHPTVFIIHGYNSRDPRRFFSLSRFLTAAGLPVVLVDYGWTGLLLGLIRVRFITVREAARLVDQVQPGDIALAHSNGAAVAIEAANQGAPFARMIFINPALRSDCAPDPGTTVERVFVLATPDDTAVLAGEWLRRLSPLRLIKRETPWGAQGRYGYTGDDPRMRTIWLHDALELPEDEKIGHSGAYRWDRTRKTGDLVTMLAVDSLALIDNRLHASGLLER